MNTFLSLIFGPSVCPDRPRPEARFYPAGEGLEARKLLSTVADGSLDSVAPPAQVTMAAVAITDLPSTTDVLVDLDASTAGAGGVSGQVGGDSDLGEVKDQVSIEIGSDPGN